MGRAGRTLPELREEGGGMTRAERELKFERAKSMFAEGLTYRTIERRLGVSWGTVVLWAKKLGIKRKRGRRTV